MNNHKQGYIFLFRSIRSKSWFKKSEYVHLWIHLLLSATHKPVEYFMNGRTIMLQPGQFVTGRKCLSSETGISESKVQRILKTFENEQQIAQQTNNKCRLISIVEWSNYQHFMNDDEQNKPEVLNSKRTSIRTTSEQQVNNKRTTDEQQVNTKQEHKNKKNIKTEEQKNVFNEKKEIEISEIENEIPLHLIASKKMIEFLENNSGTTKMIVDAAKFKGDSEQLNDEIARFFSYYSEGKTFLKKAINEPMLITGKVQLWLSNSNRFKKQNKPKNELYEKGNSQDFKNGVDETLSKW